jgi:regulator of sigma E protease
MNAGTILTIVEFVILFGLLIFMHELGHFLAARLFKIEVEEFGFGFPPRMLTLGTVWGTKITLNWIPFGGFVRPKAETDASVKGGLASASPWVRLSVALAGPVMNLIIGLVLFSTVFMQTGAPNYSKVEIYTVSPNSPAEAAGLMVGDRVVAMNGEPINSTDALSSMVQANIGQELSITYQRNGQNMTVTAVPRENPPEGEGALGIGMSNPVEPITWYNAIPLAGRMTFEQTRQLVSLPAQLIQGTVDPEQARFVGPKGVYDIYSQARERDEEIVAEAPQTGQTMPAVNTLFLMGTLSVALGLTNLLPIPALDGGRILFTLPEILFRKRIPQEYENLVHLVGFAMLLVLMIYITTQDILNPIVLP